MGIVNLIADQEVCVCFFVEILKRINQRLAGIWLIYVAAGIVAARREGIWMHYRISSPKDENAAKVLMDVREWLASDPAMQQDRKRLDKICWCTGIAGPVARQSEATAGFLDDGNE